MYMHNGVEESFSFYCDNNGAQKSRIKTRTQQSFNGDKNDDVKFNKSDYNALKFFCFLL